MKAEQPNRTEVFSRHNCLADADSEIWDCLVIGGGPAGAMAAIHAARSGMRTMVVEKQTFPRDKVCGACLNHRAFQVLRNAGLASTIDGLNGETLNRFSLRGYGASFERQLPMGLAVSRSLLDQTLLQAAEKAGAIIRTGTAAKVLPEPNRQSHYRTIALKPTGSNGTSTQISAKVVIVADGLGHPSLNATGEFKDNVNQNSYIGIGASLGCSSDIDWVPRGCITMAATEHGYGGLVRIESGYLNVAGAVSPDLLKSCGSPQATFQWLLTRAGFPMLPEIDAHWRGTPALSRAIDRVVGHRILVIGDAAGYVEPFTGEGMAWAFIGGQSVCQAASMIATDDCDLGCRTWNQQWAELVKRRQQWCRRLAWLLRHRTAARLTVSLAAAFPRITDRVVNQINAELSA
ncbi:NAD(P)/FAD-dependent oxidoreductase [Rhodopirellula sp. MGV]|uniref:NAD(P)/FAD-dependent oxidoreductase n=1 Tax=Rhodopirellula sp. MGV TaxID=2023130 RepID=UPI0013045B34|nr:FAD-dependent monooxygenase [Rhodopirellula sp. MGV]